MMMEFILMNDRATVGVVWTGAFNKRMSESRITDEDARAKDAVTYADTIVRNTQPSSLPIDLNALQRSEGYMRYMTSFMTWAFRAWDRLMFNAHAVNDGAISKGKFAKHVFLEYVLASVSGQIISSLLGRGELPEWYELTFAPFWFVPGNLPFVRDIKSYIYYGSPIGGSIVGERVERVTRATLTVKKDLEGEARIPEMCLAIGKAVEAMTGILAIKTAEEIYTIYKGISNIGE
jgi:hypothetical protein